MKNICVLIFLLLSIKGFAQIPNADSITVKRNQLIKTNMTVLAAWAGANIVQGTISATNATGSNKYFFKMNAYWNTVNLAIAGVSLYALKKEMTKKLSLQENMHKQNQLEKILLLNTGLDAAYVMSGLYLNERGKRLTNETTQGYGSSLILQGSFLLVFDVIQYLQHHKNGKPLEKLCLGATTNGVGLSYNF
jgi:hypothetical protein